MKTTTEEMKALINAEIEWCLENPAKNLSKDFQKGFKSGLQQGIELINLYEQELKCEQ
jgi:hypothetical protein